jgi:hypothetical protein
VGTKPTFPWRQSSRTACYKILPLLATKPNKMRVWAIATIFITGHGDSPFSLDQTFAASCASRSGCLALTCIAHNPGNAPTRCFRLFKSNFLCVFIPSVDDSKQTHKLFSKDFARVAEKVSRYTLQATAYGNERAIVLLFVLTTPAFAVEQAPVPRACPYNDN